MESKDAFITCPQCNAKNLTTKEVCGRCGASLRSPAVASLQTDVPEGDQAEKPNPILQAQMQILQSRVKAGANWYYAIALLSLVNAVIFMTGNYRYAVIGLGLTPWIDSLSAQLIKNNPQLTILIQAFDLLLNILAAGVFAWFGYQAHKRRKWAYPLGMSVYLLDGILFLLAQDLLGFGFHLFGLFGLYQGMRAMQELKKREDEAADRIPAA